MKIAIISDIHDNIWKLEGALTGIADRGAEALCCCGDLCAPFIVPQLAKGFSGPIHIVFGNNDGDPYRIAQNAAQFEHVSLHGEFAELELGGKRVALVHFPELGRPLASSGRYDLVCFGHDHTYADQREGETLLVNPGEIMGRFGTSTFVIYDTELDQATRHEV